jgi:hypothetical protein
MMARTISEIKKQMTDAWMADETVIEKYGLETGSGSWNKTQSFESVFPKTSIESIFFYDLAYAIWENEKLFDVHIGEINAELDTRLAHRQQWYRDKALKFQYPGRSLITDTDRYNNTGLTDAQIEDLQVVKYCATEEYNSVLRIKVAKGAPGAREVLSAAEAAGLEAYLNEIKDAGVMINIINQQADKFSCKMLVLYNPMALDPANKTVENTIKEFVSNLDFNGEYSNMALIDHLQAISGVVLPHLYWTKTQRANNAWVDCPIKTVAESGYFIVNADSDLQITYQVYRSGDLATGTGSGSEIGVVNPQTDR